MADRPILFSAPMIRALLDGRKTQTRRVLKPQPIVEPNGAWRWEGRNGGFVGAMGTHVDDGFPESAKDFSRFQPGDRLWVKETYSGPHRMGDIPPRDWSHDLPIHYWADSNPKSGDWGRPKPSIHMPRWASRLTLVVTDVRVERLQDISEADAIAEGVRRNPHGNGDQWIDYPEGSSAVGWIDPRDSFRSLWDGLNAARGFGWGANPWVVALTFTVHRCNIDQMEVGQ